jgi:hypothetical protein
MYTVSGLNVFATPISIAWEDQGTSAVPANIDKIGASNGNIWSNGAYSATPVVIACYFYMVHYMLYMLYYIQHHSITCSFT